MRFWQLIFGIVLLFSIQVGTRAEQPRYPVINELELFDRVKKAGEGLIKSGQAKGTKELCPQLKREKCSLALPSPGKQRLTDRELYAQACDSVYIVVGMAKSVDDPEEYDFASATAFAVTADGVLTTSRHVFGDPQPLEVFFVVDSKGNAHAVEEILAADEKKDTCYFRTTLKETRPLPLGRSQPPGARVRVVSHPGYFFYFFSAGNVGNYYRDEDELTWLNVTADFGQGASGAPVFDDVGNVVGQVGSTLTLYAGGGVAGDPMIQCRRMTRLGQLTRGRSKPRKAFAEAVEAALEPKDAAPNAVAKPVPAPMPVVPKDLPVDPALEETSDPQMVFKTCVTVEAMRSLIKKPREEKRKDES